MLSHDRFIAILSPVAPTLLSADAHALAQVRERRDVYAVQDRAVMAQAVAMERRMLVATAARQQISGNGWTFDDEYEAAGGYRWLVDDDAIVRLSKTTREKRASKSAAYQPMLDGFREDELDHPDRETILIRLDGEPLGDARVTAALLKDDGRTTNYSFDMRDLAHLETVPAVATTKPTTGIALPATAIKRSDNAQAG
ncbi:MAG: hypothetical protein M0P31_15340 [Solirubrobacteraceae bacterium]|nr:hypothetical protein [Solirubrobacteraceae bacterium]